MKNFKIFSAIITLSVFLSLLFLVFAQEGSAQPNDVCSKQYDTGTLLYDQCIKLKEVGEKSGFDPQGTFVGRSDISPLSVKVGQVISLVLSAFGVVFLALVVFSGIQWMTAGGNEEKVTKARERIMRAAIGLGIIIMAWSITTFIINQLQTTTSTLPACTAIGGTCETSCDGAPELQGMCTDGKKCCNTPV